MSRQVKRWLGCLIVLIVILGGLGYFGYRRYQSSRVTTETGFSGDRFGTGLE